MGSGLTAGERSLLKSVYEMEGIDLVESRKGMICLNRNWYVFLLKIHLRFKIQSALY